MPAQVNQSLLILVVTDDARLGADLRQLLEHEAYRVAETADLTHCLPLCKQLKPNLLIIDFRMAHALEACRMIRNELAEDSMRIVALFDSPNLNSAIHQAIQDSELDEAIPLTVYLALLGRRLRSALGEEEQERTDAERYRALFKRSLDAVYISDLSGNFVDVNDAGLQLLGYSRQELFSLNVADVLNPHNHAYALDLRKQVLRDGFHRPKNDVILQAANGRLVYVEASFSTLYHHGAVTSILTVAHDTTQRKQTENNEREQRLLAEALRDVAAALNSTLELDVVLDKVLDQVARVVPHDTSSIMLIDGDVARVVRHRGFADYGLNETVLSVRIPIKQAPIMQRMIETQQPTIIEDVSQDVDWQSIPVLDGLMRGYLGAPVKAQGQVIGFIHLDSMQTGLFTQKDAESLQAFADQAAIAIRNARMYEAVNRYVEILQDRVDERTLQYHRTRERLDAILHNSSDAVLVTRTDGAIVQTNRVYDELFGKPKADATLQSIVDSIFVYILMESLRSVAIDSQPRRLEISLRCLDGTSFEADAALYPIVEQDILMPLHVVCSLRDIRQRKQMELSLLQALQREKELNELKSRFVQTVSHEFRTPLAVISIASEMLKRYAHRMTPEQQRQRLDGIETAVRNMTRLLSDTMVISKAAEGRLEFKPEPIDFAALCRQVIDTLIETTGVVHQIVFTTQGQCNPVWVDPKLMEQMVEELLSNAVKYSQEGGRVELELRCEAQHVTLTVQDWGIGIPTDDAARIFEPFHRASNVGNTSGTGLGLAVVQEVVELHKGTVTFESREAEGTTFKVVLPQGN